MKYRTFQQIRNALIIICNIEQKYLLFFDNYIIFDPYALRITVFTQNAAKFDKI